jgi:hypothetical protein
LAERVARSPDARSNYPSTRYTDAFVKNDGAWLFPERLLYVDWLAERALS